MPKIKDNRKQKNKSENKLLWFLAFLSVLLLLAGTVYIFIRSFKFAFFKPKSKTIEPIVAKSDQNLENNKANIDLRKPFFKENGNIKPGFDKRHRENKNLAVEKEQKGKLPQLQAVNGKKTDSSPKGYFFIDMNLRNATMSTDGQVYGGLPLYRISGESLNILRNIGFTCGYSEFRKNPLWVAYRLDKNINKNNNRRPAHFKVDNRTKAKVKPSAYSKTGYDKGHMAPNSGIALRYGTNAQEETFLMSNIVPQMPILNRKVWSRLERYESMLANSHDNVWVITGPIFGGSKKYLKDKVQIPEAFYKIIIDEDKGNMRIMSFIVPQNVTGKEHIRQFLTSVDEIEEKTGLDFFAPMNDTQEINMEKMIPTEAWR